MKKNICLIAVSLCFAIALSEALLWSFFPTSATTSGYRWTPNGERFGWGFAPNSLVRIVDPDTGRVHEDRVNGQGWRDRDRTLEKPENTLRILVLGDSHVFGYTVPKELTFTRLAEDAFTEEGYNVEVLNISYPGWQTSQALEALKTVGMAYAPDIVWYHFCINDVDENMMWRDPGKFGQRLPFYHRLADDGTLVRESNADRFTSYSTNFKLRPWLIRHSQIARHYVNAGRVWNAMTTEPYISRPNMLGHLELVLGDDAPPGFIEQLLTRDGATLSTEDMDQLIAAYRLQEHATKIRAVLKNTAQNRAFNFHHYRRYQSQFGDGDGRMSLLRALIGALATTAEEAEIPFVISTDQDVGRYAWDLSKYQITAEPDVRVQYFAINDVLRDVAARHGAMFMQAETPVTRAADSHPNAMGNAIMARELVGFVKRSYPDLLARTRRS